MKAAWETTELGNVSTISYGHTESASSEPVGPQFLRITDIQDGHVDWESVPYCKIASADLAKYRLASGDIVFARTGATTGKSFLVVDPPEAVFASYLIRLRLTKQKLLPKFLSLFFQTSDYWKSIQAGSTGSAQGGFNATKLGALSIPVPPLPEQQRIVGILDKAFDAIAIAKANAEKNLQNARALFESHLQGVFTQRGEGWVDAKLGHICEFEGGSQPPKSEFVFRKKPGYVRFLQIRDFASDKNITYIPESKKNRLCEGNDILIGRYGASVGKILTGKAGAYNVAMIKTTPNSDVIDRAWFYNYLTSDEFHGRLLNVAARSAQNGFSKEDIWGFPVPVPPLPEQRRIVGHLSNLSSEAQRLEAIYQQKLTKLEELKKSLLHQAFTGAL